MKSSAIRDWMHEVAMQLRLFNVSLSIDDFGSAYASLSRLKDHAVSRDQARSKLRLQVRRRSAQACVSAKRSSTSRTVSARSACGEGVETAEGICAASPSSDSTTTQGFFFAKPMPLRAVARVISRKKQNDFVRDCASSEKEPYCVARAMSNRPISRSWTSTEQRPRQGFSQPRLSARADRPLRIFRSVAISAVIFLCAAPFAGDAAAAGAGLHTELRIGARHQRSDHGDPAVRPVREIALMRAICAFACRLSVHRADGDPARADVSRTCLRRAACSARGRTRLHGSTCFGTAAFRSPFSPMRCCKDRAEAPPATVRPRCANRVFALCIASVVCRGRLPHAARHRRQRRAARDHGGQS